MSINPFIASSLAYLKRVAASLVSPPRQTTSPDFASWLLAAPINAVLIGSRRIGKERDSSDWDYMVEGPQFAALAEHFATAPLSLGMSVDLYPTDPLDLDRSFSYSLSVVCSDGGVHNIKALASEDVARIDAQYHAGSPRVAELWDDNRDKLANYAAIGVETWTEPAVIARRDLQHDGLLRSFAQSGVPLRYSRVQRGEKGGS